MSNNARQAHQSGLVTAQATGVPSSLVEKFCRYEEWHHTSSHYNSTKFYVREYVRATFGLEISANYDSDPAAIAELDEYNNRQKIMTDCRVEWLEWAGTRKRPTCTKRQADGCTVEIRKNTATVTLPDGQTFKKRLQTKGFEFSQQQGNR